MGRHLGLRLPSFLLFSFLFLINMATAWGQAIPLVTQAVDDHHRVTLDGNVVPMARAEFDRGAAGNAQPMPRMLLLLKRSDAQQAALRDMMERQQDKSSPDYHAWLTPQEFGARFSPASRWARWCVLWNRWGAMFRAAGILCLPRCS